MKKDYLSSRLGRSQKWNWNHFPGLDRSTPPEEEQPPPPEEEQEEQPQQVNKQKIFSVGPKNTMFALIKRWQMEEVLK